MNNLYPSKVPNDQERATDLSQKVPQTLAFYIYHHNWNQYQGFQVYTNFSKNELKPYLNQYTIKIGHQDHKL